MIETNDSLVTGLVQRLVKILDELLAKGDWESSLFLRTSRKRLQELREEAKSVSTSAGASEVKPFVLFKTPPAVGSIQVFISVYQVAAKTVGDWQTALKALVGHSVTRPTYRNEEEVQKLIRSKTDISRHGYAIVNIAEGDIYRIDPAPVDAFGSQLISLKEGAIKQENIVGFVHANKERYSFQDGKLVLES